jgi:hypothetical protein
MNWHGMPSMSDSEKRDVIRFSQRCIIMAIARGELLAAIPVIQRMRDLTVCGKTLNPENPP